MERSCPGVHSGDGVALPVATTLEDGASPGRRTVGAAPGAASWEEGAATGPLEERAATGARTERADAAALLTDGAATAPGVGAVRAAGEHGAAGHDCLETSTGAHCSRR